MGVSGLAGQPAAPRAQDCVLMRLKREGHLDSDALMRIVQVRAPALLSSADARVTADEARAPIGIASGTPFSYYCVLYAVKLT